MIVMESVLSVAFAVSAACAALMGFAIQRGATCTVAAVDEWVSTRRATRLASMLEASLWVVAGLLLARAAGLAGTMPLGYPVGASTLLGGVLLGYGAYVNRACVFGAIARLGSGEWAYAVTPLGFYVGCVTVGALFAGSAPVHAYDRSVILDGPMWLAALAGAFVVVRITGAVLRQRVDARPGARHFLVRIARDAWSPHVATCVIGITFIVILLASGAWAYTDVLADLAHGMASDLWARTGLLLALFGGAVAGGLSSNRFRNTPVTVARLARCFTGGLLMGCGSLLIPGSNDGLVLIGLPLLRPYAWLAFATMCVVIALALVVARRASAAAPGIGVAARAK
jgi:sulfur transporter